MIQVYTGCGKGKTTAALGLAMRAAGAGFKIYFCQFIKGRGCSELKALRKIKNIKVEQFGNGCFIKKSPRKIDIDQAKKGLEKIKKAIAQKQYNVLILDEINVALEIGLVRLKDLTDIISRTPKTTELVLTGRNAHPKIIKLSDLVSEIKEVKHYFKKGVMGRKGIEY